MKYKNIIAVKYVYLSVINQKRTRGTHPKSEPNRKKYY